MPARLTSAVRASYDASRRGAALARGPNVRRKLNGAAWAGQAFPAPEAAIDLDFANSQSSIDGRQFGSLSPVSFSRASSGLYFGSDGLLKGLSRNLLTSDASEALTGWTTQGSIRTEEVSAFPPAGTRATLLTETTTNATHGIYYSFTVSAQSYTLSAYFKKGTGANAPNWFQIATGGSNAAWVNFNLNTVAIGNTSGATGTITDVGDGWRRVTMTLTAVAGTLFVYFYFTNDTDYNARGLSYAGNVTADIYVAGMQFQTGSSATDYAQNNTNLPRIEWANLATITRRNRLLSTEDFSTWGVNSGSISVNQIAAPNGLITADKYAPTGSGNLYTSQYVSTTATTFSVYAKAAEQNSFRVWTNNNFGSVNFNLSNGTASNQSSNSTGSIESVGDGWYRCIVVFLSGIRDYVVLTPLNAFNGTDGIYFWGAQAESGSAATEYQSIGVSAAGVNVASAASAATGLLIEESRTNRALWCRDFTQSSWTKTDISAALDQTGIDGVENSASSLTATAANGTCNQTITLSAGGRISSVYLKRLSGTGRIEISIDGSFSTVDISSSEWRRVYVAQTSLANPRLTIRIATNGDSVAADFAQIEDGTVVTSPIFTTSAAATRSKDLPSIGFGDRYWNKRGGAIVVDSTSVGGYSNFATTSSSPPSIALGAGIWGRTGYSSWVNNASTSLVNGVNVWSFDAQTLYYARDRVMRVIERNKDATEFPIPFVTYIRFSDPNDSLPGSAWVKRFRYIPRFLVESETTALSGA